MDRETAINAFLQRYAEDWAQGSSRSLADYRALFPGHERLVEEQYVLVAGEASLPEGAAEAGAAPELGAAPLHARTGVGFELGPYLIERELGRGGQGEVWLARDRRIGRQVALKTLTAVGRLSALGVERLRREARVASRLDHPGICTVYEADQVDGLPFVAMQWFDGASLRSVIQRAREREPAGSLPLPATTRESVATVVAFFESAARALQHAHERGVLHRDVKPGNVLVDAEGRPVLLDFGLARDLEGDDATLSEGISGTPAYLAPERLAIAGPHADPRIDVYGLGVSLYEALTLERPFAAATREHLFRAILESEPADPRRANPAISRDLAVVIAIAMAKEPDRRYDSAAAFAADLAAVRERRPIAARPPSLARRILLWGRRNPRSAFLSGSLALASVASAGLAGFLGARWPDLRAGRAAAAEDLRRERMERGFAELGDLDRGGAREAFEAALASAPHDLLARIGLSLAHLAAREPKRALALLDAHPGPPPPELAVVRAEALRWAGEWASAAALDASVPPPHTAREHFVRGVLELFRGHEGRVPSFDLAALHLTKALLQPDRGFAFQYVALTDALTHAPLEGWTEYVPEAMRVGWPDRGDVQLMAGIGLSTRDPAAAQAALERAVEIDPGSALARVSLAELILQTEGPESAATHVEPARAVCRTDSDRALLARFEARIAMREGRHAAALEELRRAVAWNPRRQLHAAELLHFVSETEGAEGVEDEARELVASHPHALRARVVLAERLIERGATAEAAALLEAVHEQTPWNANAHYLSGMIAAVECSGGAAVHHLERAAECLASTTYALELLRARLDAGALAGLATAARALDPAELDASQIERAERLARIAETTERFLEEGIPRFSATVPGTVTELEAAARAFELSGDMGEAELAWVRFARANVAPATSAGTAWWRAARAGLVAAGADPVRAARPRGALESDLAGVERAWRDGRASDRRLGEDLHRFEVEPALARWRGADADEAWRRLFERVQALREELARSVASR